jgi:hypothetical protein
LLLCDTHCNPQFPQTARNHRLRAIIAEKLEKNQKRCPVFATFARRFSFSWAGFVWPDER